MGKPKLDHGESYLAASPGGARAGKVFATQIDTLYRTSMPGVLGALAAALILVGAFIALGGLRPLLGIVWGALLGICVFLHFSFRIAYDRMPARCSARTWGRLFTLASLLDGLWWGGATMVLPAADQFEQQTLVIAVALVVAAGAVPAFASHFPALLAIFLPISLMSAVWQATQPGILHQSIVLLIGVFIVTIFTLGRRTHANLVEMISLRYERESLVDDLRRQIALAEQANMAKSRFLASASHDLRQPVHALGMFVGSLARHPMSAEAKGLVDHIEGSTHAMETLLNSMLDISRLDAGVVEPRRQIFPLGPMLERIGAEWEADAENKGIELRVCPTRAFVTSDPVLLERILRNLISNAIRYTNHGAVLVGCRRRGETVRIEVWDTGPGIAPANQQKVFEEFYQVGNPERDRSQGLGLGLSIVRRLSDLLGHPIELVSAPERGSMFRLVVQAARAAVEPAPAAPIQEIGVNTLRGTVIAVVDDDLAVLEGMRTMLSGWEAKVVAATSGNELLEQLGRAPVRPAIVLCDYRLRAGEDGTEVITRLQEMLGERIPAILITGDTATDRVRLAYNSGFHVLHKPIAPGKLRALIGNLLISSTGT
ncbi:hybrid sensor histidine kinase/response regulator [Bradyrhizobium sp. INPA01-394B]|uniref:histidine kinase n=1 Tax=Bradyrhizobium campsiandrae TaxID=1729892 RepID=A0ABR7UIN3_9BRAD|nr:hybrid sensor histidine kinase/response regulator [Bradyrhizobium campsiandrae]MBC9883568.1 hybrid sensor histidine kinase/response regulator [Bradyrhizobium campsiandrae]MBC9983461.1 hybrid sensor histidine kinase/response regulator [Bradyrhizobium campsiandrae]